MTLYQKFKNLKIDHAAIGLRQQKANDTTYFCTPEGAQIIGWGGVDGIHYCFIRGFGEMVFAVNPSNAPGDYVHPRSAMPAAFLRKHGRNRAGAYVG